MKDAKTLSNLAFGNIGGMDINKATKEVIKEMKRLQL